MGDETSSVTKKDRSIRYFGIGAMFFFAMALVWSVDTSLIYIFLGEGAYFIFLGFYNKPSGVRPNRAEEPRSYQQSRTTSYSSEPTLVTEIKKLFRQRTSTQGTAQPTTVQANRKTIKIFLAIFIGVFMIPILFSIFGSGSDAADAAGYLAIADQQYANQQYDSAYLNYRSAMRSDPELKEAFVGYGNALVIRNEGDSAILMYDKALEIDPDFKEAVYAKGMVYYNQKKYNEGIELIKPVLESYPDYYQAMLLLGDFYYVQDKLDDAIIWYGKAYEEGGMRGSTLCYFMGYIYETKKDTNKAIELYKEALTYDESIVDIYDRLGTLVQGEEASAYRAKAAELRKQ